MTQSLPIYDFSTTPEQRAKESAKIDQAIADAEAAMQVQQLENSIKKDAPAVAKIKAKKLVAPKKAAAKTTKSGRVVGISADENKMLLNLLQTVQNDSNYATIVKDAAFSKILARYNK